MVAYNLGSLYWRAGRLDEAVGPLEFAAQRMSYPGARENLGNVYLGLGRDAEGWPLYDERPQRLNAPTHKLSYPEWRGEALAGKRLLIWGEQGLGDQILAARFVPQLGAAAVTLACEPALVRLFSGLGATATPRAEIGAAGPHDYWTMMMSLPRWGGAIPTKPYLHGRATRRGGGVGVVWRGNALPDPARSLPPELGAELLALPGAVSLHPDDTGAKDFQDTADLIAGLDSVVSVDTSAAHLAGAMGKRAIVLLKHRCGDWRWRSPPAWYPSVEMLHQPQAGDWRAVLDAVRTRLG